MSARTEAELQNAIFLKFGREPDVTLWRNNTGQAKTPICERSHLERMLSLLVSDGGSERSANFVAQLIRALLDQPQRFTRYGLSKGSSDCIGIVQKEFDVNGCCNRAPMGIFLAAEFKTATGRVSPEQQMFLDLVNKRGGVAGVVRSEDDMQKLIDRARAL